MKELDAKLLFRGFFSKTLLGSSRVFKGKQPTHPTPLQLWSHPCSMK